MVTMPGSGAPIGVDRAANPAAIRAHIDRIFQAFIHKDAAGLRATHAAQYHIFRKLGPEFEINNTFWQDGPDISAGLSCMATW